MEPKELTKWLLNNRVTLPTAMDDELWKSAKKAFHSVFPGGNPFGGSDIYRIGTVEIKINPKANSVEYSYGYTRATAYHAGVRLKKEGAPEACGYLAKEFLRQTRYGKFLMDSYNLWGDTHYVYAHVDAYRNRLASNIGWHKDTWGYTMFVGLLYLNNVEITGPDLILNPTRLRNLSAFPDEGDTVEVEVDNDIQRPNPYLPAEFVKSINAIKDVARGKRAAVVSSGMVPKQGMVTFVDELVHHSTPDHSNADIAECGVDDGTYYRLRPKMDFRQLREKCDGDNKPRAFIRLWITLVPKSGEGSEPSKSNDTRVKYVL